MTKFEFELDCDSHTSLVKLAKLTSSSWNLRVSSNISSRRINNRTWRLLNLKGSHNNKFQDLKNQDPNLIDFASIKLTSDPNQPVLFSNNTNNTLFSQHSNLSLSMAKTSSHSSLSNMSNIDEESHCEEREKNIFFIAKTPSPEDGDKAMDTVDTVHSNHSSYNNQNNHNNHQNLNHHKHNNHNGNHPHNHNGNHPNHNNNTHNHVTDNNQENITNIPIKPGVLVRQDSLFKSLQSDRNLYSNSMTDSDIEEDSEEDDISEYSSEDEREESDKECDHDYRKSSVHESMNGSQSQMSDRKSTRSDNDSEWMSVSSEDDTKSEISLKPINFSRKPLGPSRQVSSDTIILGKESPPFKPKSLLSGLFLNEMAHQRNFEPQSVPKQESNGSNGGKPILKRSSTTGIITIAQNQPDTNSKIKIQRPSIMFHRKFTSSSDISKNYPHHKNNIIKNHIVNDSKKLEEDEDDEKTGLFGKQKSIVGISDFNVTSGPSLSTKALQSSRGISVSPKQSILSTSLNKYNNRSSNSNLYASINEGSASIKTMLSKSSLNLTGLFQSKKYNSRNMSVEKHEKYSKSYESRGNHLPIDLPSGDRVKTGDRTTDGNNSGNDSADGNNSGNNSGDATVNKTANMSIQITDKSIQDRKASDTQLSMRVPNKSNQDLKVAPSNGQTLTSHPFTEISKIKTPQKSLPMDAKLSPNSTRKTMLDTELSRSLKDSIIIDYKLGKVPLPEKIVGSKPSNYYIDDEEVDDYYSKGW